MPPSKAAANGRAAGKVAEEFDFDALVAARKLEPVPFKLGGRTYQVRRDLTAQERREADRLLLQQPGRDGDIDGAAILLGWPDEDGVYETVHAEEFTRAAAKLPHDIEAEVWARVLIAARIATRPAETPDGDSDEDGEDGDGPGESTASSPA